jgi:hypothetical protein
LERPSWDSRAKSLNKNHSLIEYFYENLESWAYKNQGSQICMRKFLLKMYPVQNRPVGLEVDAMKNRVKRCRTWCKTECPMTKVCYEIISAFAILHVKESLALVLVQLMKNAYRTIAVLIVSFTSRE